ncbi:MAG: TIGR02266 family protein [Myxococcaceae bacterium]|nr:TIGR02266 family protein [Myxococcaceae bacterium]
MADKANKSASKTGASQRRHDRLHHELLVAYRSVDGFITDWATNISRGGIFINTRKPHPPGSLVRLIISLPDTAFPFDLTGRVTRVNEFDNPSNQVPGMAIEFVDVDEEKKARIERFVERLRKELPDPPEPRAAQRK